MPSPPSAPSPGSPRDRFAFGTRAVLAVLVTVAALAACGGGEADDGGSVGDAGGGRDGHVASGGDATATPLADGGDAGHPGDAGGADAPSAGGRGIQVTVNGASYALTNAGRAAQGGNGYSVQANRIDGAQLTGFTVLLQKDTSNGGSPTYVAPTPGVYVCGSNAPPSPYQFARLQYSGAEGVYQYGDGPTCVTVTAFGAVGQPVTGTFQSTLDKVAGSGPATVTVSGSFDVDRAN